MDTRANPQFGRYEILGELGRGAMGVVYKASDPTINRIVALKTILLRGHDREQEEEFRKRFVHEAQAAGRLQHPGIVAIYDAGEDQENHDPYIVLEFVSGESLNRILTRETKLALPRALQLAEEIAEALDYAHAQGVVHRDIKPANILVTEEGRAKIADFGIAQMNLANFTMPGRVLGTPAYMAPEQLSGEGVDNRSDLFSLGVILYAMVTGHSPFHGNSATTVCFKVVNRDPMPASALDMELPPALDTVIAKAMAKDPAQRYQRGSEFAQALRQMRMQIQPGAASTPWHGLSPTGSVRTNPTAVKNHAAPGFAQKQQLLWAIQKMPVNYLIAAAVLALTCLVALVPIRHAISARKAAAAQLAAREKISSALPPAPAVAKPRDSIVAEMDVAGSTADAPAPPTPAKNALKTTQRHVSSKPRSVAAAVTQPTALAVVKPAVVPTCTLDLTVEHQFQEAVLFVWIDDQLALTRPLHGGSQKKLVVFKGFHGVDTENLQVPAGTHQVRVRAQSSDQAVDLSKTISADFTSTDPKTLHITFDKHNTTMRLVLQ